MDGRTLDAPDRASGPVGAARPAAHTKMLSEVFDAKNNNFDIIRLLAALLVLVSHCYPLTGVSMEPFAHYFGEYDTGGGWGVAIFFVISGFLVTRSVLERSTSVYVRSRALRIIPALALVTLFEVFLIGPLFTNLSLSEYFSDRTTYNHFRNISVFWIEQTLPGTFLENHVPQTNGSIWTLPIESAFYVMLPILAAVSLLKPQRIWIVLGIVAAFLAYGTIALDWKWGNQGPVLFIGGPAFTVLKEALFFLSGACLWVYRDRIPVSGGLAVCCILLLVIFGWRDDRFVAMAIALPYLVIYGAFAIPLHFKFYEKIGDLSYGTYLFAFPVQQSVVAALGRDIGPITLMLIAIPITLTLALISWYLVEKPALAIRHRSTK